MLVSGGIVVPNISNTKDTIIVSDVVSDKKKVEVEKIDKPVVNESAPTELKENQPINNIVANNEKSTENQVTILSTQEYGNKYLDLSTPALQACFELIVNKWPERFNEDVRENNIKALKVWANVCSTGIERPVVGPIYRYGQNGEFFDSDLAKTQY